MKFHFLTLLTAIVCLAGSSAQATTINFDNLSSGVTLTNQYPEATFTSTGGFEFRAIAYPGGTSAPNVIAGFSNSGTFSASSELFVDFTSPVDALSFKTVGDDSTHLATIDVFVDYALSSTFSVTADGDFGTPDLTDLSSFSRVTSIHIYNITDSGGIGYDDFNFVKSQPASQAPEPSAWAMIAVSAGVGIARLRRR